MDYEYGKRSGQIPAFGNWDYVNDLPITQYFESARQAGLLRHSSFSGDADLYGSTPCIANFYDAAHHLKKPTPTNKTKVRERRVGAQIKEQKKQGKVCDVTTQRKQRHFLQDDVVPLNKVGAPPPPKAVDEDLYKIPPELLSSASMQVQEIAHLPETGPPAVMEIPSSTDVLEEGERASRAKTEEAEAAPPPNRGGMGEGCGGGECSSQSDVDGLFCPICMQAWTSEGEHHICCLPCGHIYGMSCIKKWLRHRRGSGKCPQCNKKCTLKDLRKLYASRIVVVDEESQKKINYLETKCASLETKCTSLESKVASWRQKESKWHSKEAALHQQIQELKQWTTYLERLQENMSLGVSDSCGFWGPGKNLESNVCRQDLSCSFILQDELVVDGARLLDVDAHGKVLIIARKLSGLGEMQSLTKMSLVNPHDTENIPLPSFSKAVKDIRVCPSGGLALLASLGKNLSVLSTESNNVVLTFGGLPAAAWSCAWDINNSTYVYAGLQNGMLLVFDMRQTTGPVEFMSGLTCNPVHTVHSLVKDAALPGVTTVLSASSVGLCEWSFGGSENGPYLLPETENQGICISLASCPQRNEVVASFRPKVGMSKEFAVTQPSSTQSPSAAQIVQGSHVLLDRTGHRCYQKLASSSALVDSVRLPRSAVFESNSCLLFASGDEMTRETVLQELPSFADARRLKPHNHPVRDLKYCAGVKPGLLSCLSEDKLQLFNSYNPI